MIRFFAFATFALVACIAVQSANADLAINCRLQGQSDSLYRAPSKVLLYKSTYKVPSTWSLTEGTKKIAYASIEFEPGHVSVSHSLTVRGQEIMSQYEFDLSKCDSHQIGSATLEKSVIGAASFVSVYDCDCSVE